MKPEILIIGGPTASGKNDFALAFARQVPSELMNADSRQIYRELSIGTNQPSDEDKTQVPHHLFAFLDPQSSFSSADYERLALPLVRQIQDRNKLPVIVGGTGFYMKALLRGTWQVPEKDAVLRERIRHIARARGNLHLHKMLARLDPASASEIPPNDMYRVGRALEIFFQTGTQRSKFKRLKSERLAAVKFFVDLSRSQLRQNVESRTERLFEKGWIEEVRQLMNRYPDFENFPAARSLGYPEIIALLKSKLTLESCKQQIIQKTVQYAKRQVTWFRNQDGYVPLSSTEDLQKVVHSVLQ